MTRFGSLFLCTALGLGGALVGCGSSTPSGGAGGAGGGGAGGGTSGSVLDVIPQDNTVSGWLVDTSSTNAAAGEVAATATTEEQATTGLGLDGASEPFYAGFTPVIFAMQNYVNTSLDEPGCATAAFPDCHALMLFVVQMSSADQAASLYTSVLSSQLYAAGTNPWETPTTPLVGTNSRIDDTGTQWWINFYKGIYYVQVKMTPSYATTANTADQSKAEALRFATAVASKM